MKVMMEFQLNVLNNKSYAKLSEMNKNLLVAIATSNELKESYTNNGEITMAAKVEASIIRLKENADKIKICMVCKEVDSIESFSFGMGPLSLN